MILIWTLSGCAAFFCLMKISPEAETIIMKNLNCGVVEGCICLTHPVHVFGAGVGGKHREDPRAAPDVQDDFIFEHVLVVVHGVPVGQRSHLVFQHLLFDLENFAVLNNI